MLDTWSAGSTATTGTLGAMALFGRVLDGVTTTVDVDVLGFGERVPLSRAILHFASVLPTAESVGVGWLSVLLKVALATLLVRYLATEAGEHPVQACLLLAFRAAAGLGPGIHNVVSYATS